MNANKKSNTSRIQTTLALVTARVLPVVVNNFRNKLIGVVLAGLVLPQMAYAGHCGGGGGGNKGGGHHSGGNSSARSMQRSSGSMKSYSQKSSNFQNGGQNQFAKKTFSQPIPAKNGNTGITGKGQPTTTRLQFSGNGNNSKGGYISGANVVKPVGKFDLKTRKDFDKFLNVGGGKGTGTGGTGTGGTDKGDGGKGKGDGKHHHHHGIPWWAFVTPVVGYHGYNNGNCESGIYQQPVPVYVDSPVIVDPAPATPVNYAAPTQPAPAPSQPSNGQPVKGNSDGYVDLVLEDVEFLEPATITVGPLYMVKVRNQGTMLADKFRVGAFAQLEGELSDDAPRSVTEVSNLGAGELASVTLRLPASAMKLISTSSAGDAAFNQLLVVVDLDDVVSEIEKTNNVANLDRAALEAAAATH